MLYYRRSIRLVLTKISLFWTKSLINVQNRQTIFEFGQLQFLHIPPRCYQEILLVLQGSCFSAPPLASSSNSREILDFPQKALLPLCNNRTCNWSRFPLWVHKKLFIFFTCIINCASFISELELFRLRTVWFFISLGRPTLYPVLSYCTHLADIFLMAHRTQELNITLNTSLFAFEVQSTACHSIRLPKPWTFCTHKL